VGFELLTTSGLQCSVGPGSPFDQMRVFLTHIDLCAPPCEDNRGEEVNICKGERVSGDEGSKA
jgi:hypothetical protein